MSVIDPFETVTAVCFREIQMRRAWRHRSVRTRSRPWPVRQGPL